MSILTIHSLPIPPALAIRSGLATDDAGPIVVTEALLAGLSLEARAAIAALVAPDALQDPAGPARLWLRDLPSDHLVTLVCAPLSPEAWEEATAAVVRQRTIRDIREREVGRAREEQRRIARDARIVRVLTRPLVITADAIRLGDALMAHDREEATLEQRAAIDGYLASGEPERRRLQTAMEAERVRLDVIRTEECAEQEAQEVRELTHIGTRLTTLSPELSAQWREGLLSRHDAIVAIAASVLDPIAPMSTPERLCSDGGCPCGWREATALPPAIYAHLLMLRQRLPVGGTITGLRMGHDHLGPLDEPEPDDFCPSISYVATLTVQDGPMMLSRIIEL